MYFPDKLAVSIMEIGFHYIPYCLYHRSSSIIIFRARKTVLGARVCTWEIVPIKEETYTLLIITCKAAQNVQI